MKKTKYLALILVAAVMMMGAGYAAWTDTLVVNNTVKTGEFNVNFVKDQHYPKIFGDTGEEYIDKAATQTETDKKTTTIKINNMYPGSKVRYELQVINNGSIPAVFDYADVSFDGSNNKNILNKMQSQFGGTGYFPIKELKANIMSQLAGVRLEPNEIKYLNVEFKLPADVVNSDGVESALLEVGITINWKQHNVPATNQ